MLNNPGEEIPESGLCCPGCDVFSFNTSSDYITYYILFHYYGRFIATLARMTQIKQP